MAFIALILVMGLFLPESSALNIQDTVLSDIWDSTSQSIRFSEVASTSGYDVSEETALTNTVHPLVTFTHTTSGSPANNIGLSLDWYQETAAANTELGARMAIIATDTTATSEDFQIDWMLMANGATAATKMSLGSTGILTLVGGTLLDNTTASTLTVTETNIALVGDTTITGALVTTEGADPAEETALTNTVHPLVNLTHTTSGVSANGIGVGMNFTQETTAGNEMIMSINAVVTDVTGASEDADFVLNLMDAGNAAAEVLRVTSDGVLQLENAATIDNTVNGIIEITEPAILLTGSTSTTIDSPIIAAIQGTTGGWEIKSYEATTGALSGATGSCAVNVPTGAKLIGTQFRVDTLITSGDGATTWKATYATGSSEIAATGQAFTKDTKVNAFFNANAATDIMAGTLTITIEPDSNTFSAGVVRCISYAQVFTAMAAAP